MIYELAKVAQQAVAGLIGDFSLMALTPLLVLLAIAVRKTALPAMRRLVLYSLVLVFGVPALFCMVGHFAFYYSYLLFIGNSRLLPTTVAPAGTFSW